MNFPAGIGWHQSRGSLNSRLNQLEDTMDFTLNEDQQALQETVRKFAVSELPEIALEIEKWTPKKLQEKAL